MENYFDWKYYISNNRDLRSAGINSKELAWKHWINHGRNEGRHCLKIPKEFDWKYYTKTYKDLGNIKSEIIAYEHYLLHGKKERRKIKKMLVSNHFNMPPENKDNSINKTLVSNDFKINNNLEEYIVTILGYGEIDENGPEHTNWFPWNRFYDVFKTLGYRTEWVNINSLVRKGEKRIFITWNKPTSLELYQSGQLLKHDVIFQKLTSIGEDMKVNWGVNPTEWYKNWSWPIYKMVENLYDLGLNIYGFGCKTEIESFPEKKRICEKLKERIFWMNWGGTPFNWNQIKNCKPCMDNLTEDISFVGSKWGKVGRGNVDAWEKYISPLEKCNYKFYDYGGIGNKMISDTKMIESLQKSKICPIIHAPSWQAERGVQDRFYTVFLSGRFGICDNLGVLDIFGKDLENICTEDPQEYYDKTIYYLEHPEEQLKYIELIQEKIRKQFNFYRQWEHILNSEKIKLQSNMLDEQKIAKNNIDNELYKVMNNYNEKICNTVTIMGNGPSLKDVCRKSLRNGILVSFNRCYIIYEKENVYPLYYFCIDKAVLLNCLKDIRNLLKSPIKYFVLLECEETKDLEYNEKVTLVSKNTENTYVFGDVSTFSINYLYKKGYFNFDIYGCDCNYVEDIDLLNVDVEYNNNDPARRIVLKPRKGSVDPNHFIDNYFDDTTEYSVPRSNNHLKCWKYVIENLDSIKISFKTKSKAEEFLQ